MTTKEALEALLDGKRLREPNWPEDQYVCLYDDKLIDETGVEVVLDGFPYNLEFYNDKSWALRKMVEGYTVQDADGECYSITDSHCCNVDWNSLENGDFTIA